MTDELHAITAFAVAHAGQHTTQYYFNSPKRETFGLQIVPQKAPDHHTRLTSGAIALGIDEGAT